MKNILLVLLIVIGSCETRQQSISYKDQIANHRDDTDKYMNEAQDSPFANVDSVIRLNYYPINKAFSTIASIERIERASQLTLGTSDGIPRVFTRHAILKFVIASKSYQLLVLKGVEEKELFLAFGDLTNDNGSYGGGRYINLNFSEQSEKITLDFNKAYNPYCEYNSTYSCPLPPVENYLNIAVEAGEKTYK